jgi:hypothetical protein
VVDSDWVIAEFGLDQPEFNRQERVFVLPAQGRGEKSHAGQDDEGAQEPEDQARVHLGLIQKRPAAVVLRSHDSMRRTWPALHM